LASGSLSRGLANESDELGDGPCAIDGDEQRVERRLEEEVVYVEEGGAAA
jgi:hypothetical protein